MMQALTFPDDDAFFGDQPDIDARLVEIAWQLYAEHALLLEGPKHGTWQQIISPALELCKQLPSLEQLRQANADILTSEAAFLQYARG